MIVMRGDLGRKVSWTVQEENNGDKVVEPRCDQYGGCPGTV